MVEQILPDLYRIEIPIPKSPLKALNSYIIKGQKRFLIVDTGMNREECRRAMLSGLEKLDVDLNRTDFFITHLHADHAGLVGDLAAETSKVYFSAVEAALADSLKKGRKARFQELYSNLKSHGFPEDELDKAITNHPGFRFRSNLQHDISALREGDEIDTGNYRFRCIETPGHSPGHMCLYEARKKILIAGDHILFDISPNITRWPELKNPLKDYLASLEKVYGLDVSLVLPGHRNIMTDHRGRIRELRKHHEMRLKEVIASLKERDKTAWEVAPHISWDMVGPWERFPPAQKWFAVGETIAHLQYLEAEGVIRVLEEHEHSRYSVNPQA